MSIPSCWEGKILHSFSFNLLGRDHTADNDGSQAGLSASTWLADRQVDMWTFGARAS